MSPNYEICIPGRKMLVVYPQVVLVAANLMFSTAFAKKRGLFKKKCTWRKKRSHGNNFRNGLFKWQFLRSLHFPKNSSTLLPSANKSKITYIYTMYFLHFYGKKILLPVVNYFCKVLLLQQQQNKSFFFFEKSISSQHQKYLLL